MLATQICDEFGHLEAQALLEPLINQVFKGKIVVSSSFGAESVVLLHMVACTDNTTPVIFIDTGKHFTQTLKYRQQLTELLDLTNVHIVRPENKLLETRDPYGELWKHSTDACCEIRKVMPFDSAIKAYSAIITGRKRYQNKKREQLNVIEYDGTHFKINPVARWNTQTLQAYMEKFALPAHPLVFENFLSIGCECCTSPIEDGESSRAGRWRGENKTECGIHKSKSSRISAVAG